MDEHGAERVGDVAEAEAREFRELAATFESAEGFYTEAEQAARKAREDYHAASLAFAQRLGRTSETAIVIGDTCYFVGLTSLGGPVQHMKVRRVD